jgi:hypothetical protein
MKTIKWFRTCILAGLLLSRPRKSQPECSQTLGRSLYGQGMMIMRVIEIDALHPGYLTNSAPAYMTDLMPILERLDKLERENTILKNKIRRMQR